MKYRFYISGPMDKCVNHNFEAFFQMADILSRKHQISITEIFNPALNGVKEGWTWSDYLRYDLSQLMESEVIVMLPGWTFSEGANLEFFMAVKLGIPINFATEYEENFHIADAAWKFEKTDIDALKTFTYWTNVIGIPK